MKQVQYIISACVFILFLFGRPLPAETTDVENLIEKPVQKAVRLHQEISRSESEWRTEKEKQMALLSSLEKEKQVLEAKKTDLFQSNAALTRLIESKTGQLTDMEQISTQISPFLEQVIDRLRHLYETHLPFLKKERENRIKGLEAMMSDPQIPINEKYRRIMEALQVEADYGRTIETYQETLQFSGQDTLVRIFRLGRLNLFYQTLDGQKCGAYNMVLKTWEPLPDKHLKSLRVAMEIASRQRPAQILSLPIGRITVK